MLDERQTCCAGEEYRVRLFDGSEKTVNNSSLAMNFMEGDKVIYTPPKGGETIKGTIIASNGNFWYKISPMSDPECVLVLASTLVLMHASVNFKRSMV